MYLMLKILAGKHVGKELRVTRTKFIIGRGDDCHLRATSTEVSRNHCEITLAGGGAFIQDMGSTNGTYVNGQRLQVMRPILSGDVLIVGPLMFEVRMADPEEVENERSGWDLNLHEDGISLVTDEPETAVENSKQSGATRMLTQEEYKDLAAQADLAGQAPAKPRATSGDTALTSGGRETHSARTFKTMAASPFTKDIMRSLEEYIARVPGTSWGDARNALRQALLLVDQKEAPRE